MFVIGRIAPTTVTLRSLVILIRVYILGPRTNPLINWRANMAKAKKKAKKKARSEEHTSELQSLV